MPDRLRKLIGSILLVTFVIIYALIVMTIAAAKLPGTSGLTQLLFYLVTGLAWVVPAGALIYWMQRSRRGT
jgi:peptidoglycan/LPS O-acetylase OafA/YrhL